MKQFNDMMVGMHKATSTYARSRKRQERTIDSQEYISVSSLNLHSDNSYKTKSRKSRRSPKKGIKTMQGAELYEHMEK